MPYYKEYPYVTENIDQSYDQFVGKLKEIIVLTDQLFATQIHPQYGVYPEGIAAWLEKHPAYKTHALSVTRIEKDTATEIPYNVFYAQAVAKIAKLLAEAKESVDKVQDDLLDKSWWKEYMSVLQEGYLQNKWEEAEIFFLSLPPESPLLLTLGPIDTYHDKVTGTKQFFSGWLLVRNTAQKEINTLLRNVKKLDENTSSNVSFFVGDLLFAGGEVAKHNTMGWSRPGDTKLLEKYGAIKTIAFNKIPQQTKRMSAAIDKSLQKWDISKGFAKEIITFHTEHSLLPLVLHEYSHTVKKHPKAHQNLGAFYTDIEETRANTMMIFLAESLIKKNQLPAKSAMYMFLRVLLYIPYLYEEYTVRQQRESYYFAALYWLQKAEEYGIVTIGEKVTLNKKVLDEQLEIVTSEILKSFENISQLGESEKALAKQKQELFLYGADLAIKLAW